MAAVLSCGVREEFLVRTRGRPMHATLEEHQICPPGVVLRGGTAAACGTAPGAATNLSKQRTILQADRCHAIMQR